MGGKLLRVIHNPSISAVTCSRNARLFWRANYFVSNEWEWGIWPYEHVGSSWVIVDNVGVVGVPLTMSI